MNLERRTEQALYEIHVLRDMIINGEWVGFHKFAKVITEAMEDAHDIGCREARGDYTGPRTEYRIDR